MERSTPTKTRTRTLSLRAPITNEDERALFQRRLATTSISVFLLAFGFYVINAIGVAVVSPQHLGHVVITSTTAQMQLATTFAALGAWLFLRSGPRSVRLLGALDSAITIALCIGWTAMVSLDTTQYHNLAARAEYISILACTYTLVTRAAFIPSTPARTFVLHALAFAPIVPATYMMYVGTDVTSKMPLSPAAYAAIWIALGLAATTLISHVIYGLRLQVRKAMQLGQYILEEKIGEGGMGSVYRARHALLRRPTAIKLLTGSDGTQIERFEREVQITAGLTHPNTIAVFDYGRTPDGVFYYAMEYLDGVSLEDLVEQHGAQPIARVVHILAQVCGALEEAHGAGLVHRDIKPANIMLTERGGVPDVVKVLDFGLVKESIEAEKAAAADVTSATVILGTPHYMAPEVILDPKTVDGRADLYALGATAYFLLTGERVFDGSSLVEVCSKHLHEAPRSPSKKRDDIPPALEAAVMACLAKKPEGRPRDAAALAAALREAHAEAWTRDQARGWWAEHAMKAASTPPPSQTSKSPFERTVAVALEDRAAS